MTASSVPSSAVEALRSAERVLEAEVFARLMPLEGVERPSVEELQRALDEVRAALRAGEEVC